MCAESPFADTFWEVHMGLFSRKTDKEIIAEGRDLFYKGDFAGADKKLMKLAMKGNDEACYWIGRISVETGARYHDSKRIKTGKFFLEKSAKQGNRDACAFLERYFDVPNPYAEKENEIFIKETEPAAKEDEAVTKENSDDKYCSINIKESTPEEKIKLELEDFVMRPNAIKLLEYLKCNQDKDVTSKDAATALDLDSRQIDGIFTSAFVRKGLGERVVDGAKKYLKLTSIGKSYKP